jgi:hypothetical protein
MFSYTWPTPWRFSPLPLLPPSFPFAISRHLCRTIFCAYVLYWRQPDDHSTSHSLPTLVAPWIVSSDIASIKPGKNQTLSFFKSLIFILNPTMAILQRLEHNVSTLLDKRDTQAKFQVDFIVGDLDKQHLVIMRCCVRCLLSSRTLILFAIACGLSNFQEDWCRNFPHLEINGDIFYYLKIESSATYWCLLTTDDFLRIAMAFNEDIFS